MEKPDPMELKMPVAEKNQMVVRVEGGYKQITIQSLEKSRRQSADPRDPRSARRSPVRAWRASGTLFK